MGVRLKRVYAAVDAEDGHRVLVDRLWPRGMTKERASCDLWLKDVAPSPALRTEWHAAPERFAEFAARYRRELESNPAVEVLRSVIADHPTVTLVYDAADEVANHAVVLVDFLDRAGADRSEGP